MFVPFRFGVARTKPSPEVAGVELSELRFARAVLQQRLELRRSHAKEATFDGEFVIDIVVINSGVIMIISHFSYHLIVIDIVI